MNGDVRLFYRIIKILKRYIPYIKAITYVVEGKLTIDTNESIIKKYMRRVSIFIGLIIACIFYGPLKLIYINKQK